MITKNLFRTMAGVTLIWLLTACMLETLGNPDYLTVIPLHNQPSKYHPETLRMIGSGSKRYYSIDEKLLNLSHFKRSSANQSFDETNDPAISIRLNRSGVQRLSEYAEKHEDGTLGIFLDGTFVAQQAIRSVARDTIMISGGFSKEEVEYHIAAIRNGRIDASGKKRIDLVSERTSLKQESENPAAILDKHKRIEKLDESIKRGMAMKNSLESSRQEVYRLREEMWQAEESLGNRPNIDLLVKSLESLASQCGLHVDKFQPLPERRKEFYGEIPIHVQMIGGYHELGFFFEKIAGETRMMNVTDLVVRALQREGAVSATFTISAFWYIAQ